MRELTYNVKTGLNLITNDEGGGRGTGGVQIRQGALTKNQKIKKQGGTIIWNWRVRIWCSVVQTGISYDIVYFT